MKSVLEYILISEGYILEGRKPGKYAVTTDWMKKMYKKFNKIYFNNELPACELEAVSKEKMHKDTWLGQFGFEESWFFSRNNVRNGHYVMYTYKKVTEPNGDWNWKEVEVSKLNSITELRPKIKMSQKYEYTWEQMEDTLIHEMIHFYTYLKGLAPKQAHGPQFRAKCDLIREMAKQNGKNYELEIYAKRRDEYQLTADEQEKLLKKQQAKISKDCFLYYEFDPNKIGFGTCSKYLKRFGIYSQGSLNKVVEDIKHYDNQSVKIIYKLSPESISKLFKKYGSFRTCRTYRFWDATTGNYEWVQDLVKQDKNKQIIFKA